MKNRLLTKLKALDICHCGHKKADHIYCEGACRPGFICECPEYKPANTHSTIIQMLETAVGALEWYANNHDLWIAMHFGEDFRDNAREALSKIEEQVK